MTDQMTMTEPPEGYVLVEFTRGGAIAPRGLATGQRYRRVGHGDRFYVDPADLAAETGRAGGAWFMAVTETADVQAEEQPAAETVDESAATPAKKPRSRSKPKPKEATA
ncbi:hypothetical protein ACFLYO_09750 [Chloroflexota bacterium]